MHLIQPVRVCAGIADSMYMDPDVYCFNSSIMVPLFLLWVSDNACVQRQMIKTWVRTNEPPDTYSRHQVFPVSPDTWMATPVFPNLKIHDDTRCDNDKPRGAVLMYNPMKSHFW